jgi:hypothetical protein
MVAGTERSDQRTALPLNRQSRRPYPGNRLTGAGSPAPAIGLGLKRQPRRRLIGKVGLTLTSPWIRRSWLSFGELAAQRSRSTWPLVAIDRFRTPVLWFASDWRPGRRVSARRSTLDFSARRGQP